MTHNWKAKAETLGFKDELEMFQTLYKTMSLQSMAKALGISFHTCRKKLVEHGVTVKSRGGPNSQKCVMNAAVIEEMRVKGADAVALAQGVSKYTLFKQKANFIREKQAEVELIRAAEQTTTPGAPPPSPEPSLSGPEDPTEE